MIITRLRLENFLAHDNTDIEFSQSGITAIIGENGSGKTSILEGIYYALFGESSKGNLGDIVKWGRSGASVELEFIKGNRRYKIVREIKKTSKGNTTNAFLYRIENSREILEKHKNLNKELPAITGLSKKTFLNSVLVRQGEIEGLLRLKPSEREKVIEELLDLHLYVKLQEKYKELRRKEENNLELLESQKINKEEIEKYLTDIESKLKALEEEIEKLQKEKENIENQLKQVEKSLEDATKKENEKKIKEVNLRNVEIRLKELENQLQEIRNLKEKLPSLEKDVEKLQELENTYLRLQEIKNINLELNQILENLKEIQEKIKFKQSFEPVFKEIVEKSEELKNLNETIKDLQRKKGEISQLQNQIQQKSNDLKNKEDKYKQIVNELLTYYDKFRMLLLNPLMIQEHINQNEYKIQHLEQEITSIKEQKATVETEGKQLRQKLDNLNSIQGECPTCGRPLEEHKKEELRQEIEKELVEKRNLYNQLKQKEKELSEELEKQKKIKDLLLQLNVIYESIKEVKKEVEDGKFKLKALEDQVKNLDSLMEKEKEIKEFIDKHREDFGYYQKILKENLEQKEKELLNRKISLENSLNQKLTGLNVDLNLIDKEISKINSEINLLKPKRDYYNQILAKIKEEEKLLKEKVEKEEEKKHLEEDIQALQTQLNDLNIEGLKNQKEKLTQTIQEKLNLMSEKNIEFGKLKGEKGILEQQLIHAERQEREMENLRVRIKKYQKLENALQQLQKLLKDNALYNIPRITEDIFSKFGFNQFINLRFTDKYDIELTANALSSSDIKVSIDALSGGQRIALSIALRLAIAKILNEKTDFLILDEPTIHLDESRKKELVDLLGDLKESNFIRQLIVVTHDDEIKERADVIYKVSYGSVVNVEAVS